MTQNLTQITNVQPAQTGSRNLRRVGIVTAVAAPILLLGGYLGYMIKEVNSLGSLKAIPQMRQQVTEGVKDSVPEFWKYADKSMYHPMNTPEEQAAERKKYDVEPNARYLTAEETQAYKANISVEELRKRNAPRNPGERLGSDAIAR